MSDSDKQLFFNNFNHIKSNFNLDCDSNQNKISHDIFN